MENAIVVRGRQVGPNQIETDEKLSAEGQELAVIVLALPSLPSKQQETIFDFIRRLPPGTRTREEIDRLVAGERDW